MGESEQDGVHCTTRTLVYAFHAKLGALEDLDRFFFFFFFRSWESTTSILRG